MTQLPHPHALRALCLGACLSALLACRSGPVIIGLQDRGPDPAPEGTPAGTSRPPLPPPGPQEDPFDWIRLVSGEWLKGELHLLRDDSIEFESEELDNLKIDWGDVVELRSPRPMQLLLEGRVVELGTLHVLDDSILLTQDGVERSIRRSELLALIPGEPSEWNYWSAKIGLGMTLRSGNTDQSDATATVDLARHTPETRLLADYLGNFSEVDRVTTANNHRATGKFDVFLSRRLFLMPAALEYYRDTFQNLAYRLSPAAGLGYELIDQGGVDWNVTAAAGYQYTRFDSVQPGNPVDDDTMALTFGTTLEWDLTSKVEFDGNYRIQVPLPASDQSNHHLEVVLSVDLIDELELDLSFVWDRNGQLTPDSNGVLPEPDDYRLTVGLSWEL